MHSQAKKELLIPAIVKRGESTFKRKHDTGKASKIASIFLGSSTPQFLVYEGIHLY